MNRLECIQYLAARYRARTYLEVGVRSGGTFFPLRVTRKIGVDPVVPGRRRRLRAFREYPGNLWARLYEETSDEFFQREAPRRRGKLDLVFVDGKHTYEQAYRDISNALALLSPRGIVVVHDANPAVEAQAWPAESPEEAFATCPEASAELGWCGDVWKAIVHTRVAHPAVGLLTVADDYGLAVFNPRLPAPVPDIEEAEVASLGFADLAANRSEWLHLGGAADLAAWIDGDPVAGASESAARR